jgi:zinc transporter, ZIP family
VGDALFWGVVAASSLVFGVVLGLARAWPEKLIGLVLAFGAGALVSGVSFELFEQGVAVGGAASVGVGLAAGALVYFVLARAVERIGPNRSQAASGGGTALALGAFLDGIPEQIVLGIGIAAGEGVSVALLVAIFVSNLPEGIGSATDMSAAGTANSKIARLFVGIALVCTLASGVGFAIADSISNELQAAVNGFAAGALLVMLIDSMTPEAREKAGRPAGLATVVGFAVATALSNA